MWCCVVGWIVHGVSKDRSGFTLSVKQFKNFLGLMTPWKRGELFTQWNWVTSQKISTSSNTAVRTSNLIHCALLHCQYECVLQDGCSINGKSKHRFTVFSLVTLHSHSQLQRCSNSTRTKPSTHALKFSLHLPIMCIHTAHKILTDQSEKIHQTIPQIPMHTAVLRLQKEAPWTDPFHISLSSLYPSPAV